jgi:hypothetical protein
MSAKLNEIINALFDADMILWKNFEAAKKNFLPDEEFKYIFPSVGPRLRISEQEARFALIHFLNKRGFYFCAEMPTQLSYKQLGIKESKASFDVGIFDDKKRKILNCELKSKGISIKAKSSLRIKKDIEKLLRDPGNGLWFHLLESVNNSTLNALFSVMTENFLEIKKDFENEIQDKSLIFHFCVLNHGFSITKTFEYSKRSFQERILKNFFHIEYNVSKNKLFSIGDNWILRRV